MNLMKMTDKIPVESVLSQSKGDAVTAFGISHSSILKKSKKIFIQTPISENASRNL
jgi:hypothetical protein